MCAVWAIGACDEEEPAQTYPYICANGMAALGTNADQNIERCASCDTGYHQEGNLCQANTHTCENGTPASGTPVTDGEARCARCHSGHHLEGAACLPNAYVCANGDPVERGTPGVNGETRCARCSIGHHLEGAACIPNAYACANGDPVARGTPGINGETRCVSCDAGHLLIDRNCRSCLPSESRMATGTNVALTETVSDSAITFTCTTTGSAIMSIDDASDQFVGDQILIAAELRNVGYSRASLSHPFFTVTLTEKSGSGASQILTVTATLSVSDLVANDVPLNTAALSCGHVDNGSSATLTLCTQ